MKENTRAPRLKVSRSGRGQYTGLLAPWLLKVEGLENSGDDGIGVGFRARRADAQQRGVAGVSRRKRARPRGWGVGFRAGSSGCPGNRDGTTWNDTFGGLKSKGADGAVRGRNPLAGGAVLLLRWPARGQDRAGAQHGWSRAAGAARGGGPGSLGLVEADVSFHSNSDSKLAVQNKNSVNSAGVIGTPFPASNLMAIGRIGDDTLAQRGLPDDVRVAYFVSGISVSRVVSARRQRQMIICPRGECDADGIVLRGCDFRDCGATIVVSHFYSPATGVLADPPSLVLPSSVLAATSTDHREPHSPNAYAG